MTYVKTEYMIEKKKMTTTENTKGIDEVVIVSLLFDVFNMKLNTLKGFRHEAKRHYNYIIQANQKFINETTKVLKEKEFLVDTYDELSRLIYNFATSLEKSNLDELTDLINKYNGR